jgi:hypothetical protein
MKLKTRFSKAVVLATCATMGAVVVSDTASAAPVTQEGLVNVNLTDVTVAVPIAVAANVCDVNVAVLVGSLSDGSAPCSASADPTSEITTSDGGPVTQQGLVNVNITDLVIQAPIGIAANVCDVNVGILVNRLRDAASQCDATATPDAITTITG